MTGTASLMLPAGAELEAERATPLGHVRAWRRAWGEPIDIVSAPRDHWLELTLLPRSPDARGGFPDRWGPHRFERIGEMFLFPAGQRVHARSDCRVQSSIVCQLSDVGMAHWLEEDLRWTDGGLAAGLDLAHPGIRALLLRLGEELRRPGFASAALVELISAQIAIELGRHCHALNDDRPSGGGLAPWRLRRIDDRLGEVGPAPALADLAALCGLSVRQLARGFRAVRGCSLGTHIAQVRIEQAKGLLIAGEGVKAVAHRLGFASPANFSAAFRRATGETPSLWRARSRH